MIRYINTKYGKENDFGPLNLKEFRKTIKYQDWLEEHKERLLITAEIMNELGIKGNVYEFSDLDFIYGERTPICSDMLSNIKKEVNIVSNETENKSINNINFINTKEKYGRLYKYLMPSIIDSRLKRNIEFPKSLNVLSYQYMDNIIIDNLDDDIDKILLVALTLGINCFLPTTGYVDSEYTKKESESKKRIASKINKKVNGSILEDVVSISGKNYVEVLKLSKPHVK